MEPPPCRPARCRPSSRNGPAPATRRCPTPPARCPSSRRCAPMAGSGPWPSLATNQTASLGWSGGTCGTASSPTGTNPNRVSCTRSTSMSVHASPRPASISIAWTRTLPPSWSGNRSPAGGIRADGHPPPSIGQPTTRGRAARHGRRPLATALDLHPSNAVTVHRRCPPREPSGCFAPPRKVHKQGTYRVLATSCHPSPQAK